MVEWPLSAVLEAAKDTDVAESLSRAFQSRVVRGKELE